MVSTLMYLAGLLAAFGVGAAAGVFFARRHEAERLDLALSLREHGLIRQQLRTPPPGSVTRWNPADAYDYDEQSWTKAAEVLGVDVHDYRKEAT